MNNEEEVILFGGIDSSKASQLVIAFERCTPTEDQICKDLKTIDDWIKDKYIYTFTNQDFFMGQVAEQDDMISRQTKLKWYPIDTPLPVEYTNRIEISHVETPSISDFEVQHTG